MPTPELIFHLALDGDDMACVEQLGIRRHLVIQQALRLADDPAVALAHPELVQRIRDHAVSRRLHRTGLKASS